jgi:dipicolinate synthase subunit A
MTKTDFGGSLVDSSTFSGLKTTLVGGDRRYDFLGETLADLGSDVWLLRRRPARAATLTHSRSLAKALEGAHVLICPMTPFGSRGRVWSEDPEEAIFLTGDDFARLASPSIAFAGSFPPEWAPRAAKAGTELIALSDLDEIAIMNSIPSAEGAVLMALERTTVTIHGSRALVLGFGRTGQTLAATLSGMGARVLAVVRRPETRARALACGFDVAWFKDLAAAAAGARFVFNTVPARVLDADVLSRVHPRAVIIDLASGQGGTDFEAARVLGLAAVLAPGLPGRVAPETAAACLAEVVIRIMTERFGGGVSGA